MKTARIFVGSLAGILLFAGSAVGQPAASQPVRGKVLKVAGSMVQHSTDGKTWARTKVGDVLDAGATIRTGINSSCQIQLHNTTFIQIKSLTRVGVAELAKSAGTEKTRLFLSYGTVRGGIVKERMTSDFQIACPAAVLSREGTWGFEFSYDPATGNFFIGLDTEGLVRVLNLRTGKQRTLTPGQFVTQAWQQWVATALFGRTVLFSDPFGTTQIEQTVYANNSGGRTAADPTGNGFSQMQQFNQGFYSLLYNPQFQQNTLQQQNLQNQVQEILNRHREPTTPTYNYPYGDFGTGIPDDSQFNIPSFLKR